MLVHGGFWIGLTLSAPASLSVCKFSVHYPHKTSCLVMRKQQVVINSNLSKIKNPKFSKRVYKQTIETVWGNSAIHHGVYKCTFRGLISGIKMFQNEQILSEKL